MENKSTNRQSFKYKAFISYSHLDEKWGRWLHHSIERYIVPKVLVGKDTIYGSVPKRLFPLFRDREELPTASNLNEIIDQALIDSSHLIVICSPNSAKSQWVNEEVKKFKKLGKQNRILCLIVDGEPNADFKPELGLEECFPAAVKFEADEEGNLTDTEAEPIAADAREGKDGKANAMLKVLAGLLGVGFDEIKQRDLIRKQKRTTIMGAVSLGFALVMGMLSVWAIGNSREAERQRGVAEIAKIEAEKQKDEAVHQKKLASNARDIAKEQEKIAVDAKLVSEAKKKDALDKLYELVIFRSNDQLGKNNNNLAKETLLKAPEDRRNFEWGFLYNESNNHIFEIKIPEIKRIASGDLNPDGNKMVISGVGSYANIHDIKSGSIIRNLENSFNVHGLRFTSSGARIYGRSFDDKIKVWDSENGNELKLNRGLSNLGDIGAMDISHDSSQIVTGFKNNSVILWDIKNGEKSAVLNEKEEDKVVSAGTEKLGITSVLFGEDGKHIYASSADNRIMIWNKDTGKKDLMELDSRNTFLFNIAISPNEKYMVSSHVSKGLLGYKIDEDLRKSGLTFLTLWDLNSGKIIKKINAENEIGFSRDLEFLKDNKSFVSYSNNGLRRYGIDGELKYIQFTGGFGGPIIGGGLLNNDEEMAYLAVGNRIKFVRLANNNINPLKAIESRGKHKTVHSKFNGDGGKVLLSLANNKSKSGAIIYSYIDDKSQRLKSDDQIRFSSFSPDGDKIATAGYTRIKEGNTTYTSGSINVFDINNGSILKTLSDDIDGNPRGLSYSKDGDHLVLAKVNGITIWDAKKDKIHSTLNSDDDPITCMSLDPSGIHIATGHSGVTEGNNAYGDGNNANAKIWSIEKGKTIKTLVGHSARLSSVSYSKNGDFIVTGSNDGSVRLWSSESFKQLKRIDIATSGFGNPIQADFFPDGKRILVAHGNNVEIWNPYGTESLLEINKSKSNIISVSIHPNGRSLIIANGDNITTVRESVPWKIDEYPLNKKSESFASRYNNWSYNKFIKNKSWHANLVKQKEENQKSLATNFDAMPEIDLSNFTEIQRKSILDIANKKYCDCGCKLTIAQCRNEDSACRRSIPMAWSIVKEVTGFEESNFTERIKNDEVKKLIEASVEGDLDKVSKLLEGEIDINYKSGDEQATVLHFLANFAFDGNPEMRYVDIAKLIINKGADVNALTIDKSTPLHLAKGANFSVFLINNGADVNLINKSGKTPIDLALGKKNGTKIEKLLKDNGALPAEILKLQEKQPDAFETEKEIYNRIKKAVQKFWFNYPYNPEPGYRLWERTRNGVWVETYPSGHQTKFKELERDSIGGSNGIVVIQIDGDLDGEYKIFIPDYEEKQSLVLYKSDKLITGKWGPWDKTDWPIKVLATRDGNKYKDIQGVIISNDIKTLKEFMVNQAEVNAKDENDMTPLHYAAYYGRKQMLKLLINKSADVNTTDKLGGTPLYIAVAKGNKEIIELLVSANAILNVNSKIGTPLHFAVSLGQKEIVEFLIAKGADVNAKVSEGPRKGNTPLDQLKETGSSNIIDLLRKHGGKTGEELKAEGK